MSRTASAQVPVRVTADMKARITEAADRNGHSYSQEVATRLRRSFEVDDLLARLVEVFQR